MARDGHITHHGTASKRRVGLVMDPRRRERYVSAADLARLQAVAEIEYLDQSEDGLLFGEPSRDPVAARQLREFAADKHALVVSHGSARVSEDVLDVAPGLSVVGDLEGDRFGARIDVEAATERGIWVVDTTHASSWPVAEWALALSILGLRHAPQQFRTLVAGEDPPDWERRGSELTGKRVGLLGLGRVAWRLVDLLGPFHVELLAHDPLAPRELGEVLEVTFAPLRTVMSSCDVVVCLLPLTEATRGLIGAGELAALPSGSVFVNVSRGAVVDSDALVARLRRGDVTACLDVYEPEPLPVDAPVRSLPNVFLSPHVAGVTTEAENRFFTLMVDELLRCFGGLEPRAQLTPRVTSGRPGSPSPKAKP
jgi:phosphoglycerate dehydrogenase-like enzyme